MTQCQIDYDWNISSCFPISPGCLGRGAVDYEAVSVSAASSVGLIKRGHGLMAFSPWAYRNLLMWSIGHFGLFITFCLLQIRLCFFHVCVLLSHSVISLSLSLQETPNKLCGVKRASWLHTCGAPRNYRSSRVMARCEHTHIHTHMRTRRMWCCPHV